RVGDARRARPDDPIESLAPAVDRARRQLMKRLSQAAGPNGADADLHRARKAGKRARYAAEVLASELPAAAATATATATAATTDEATTDEAPAVGLARRLTRLQDILGEFQDSVIVATMARELADEARARGHGTQAFGALLAIEQQRQRRCRAAARQFWVEEMTPAGGDE
ncbi:MAG: CHAD domain-containing protein, partial [Actinomycetia bacterium]|nr:CHAD domain-containing protein [Actinomycetes bacterium]